MTINTVTPQSDFLKPHLLPCIKPGKMIINTRLEPCLGGPNKDLGGPNKDPKTNQVRIPFSESSTSRHGPQINMRTGMTLLGWNFLANRESGMAKSA
jgi:hypothetical protein